MELRANENFRYADQKGVQRDEALSIRLKQIFFLTISLEISRTGKRESARSALFKNNGNDYEKMDQG